MKSKRAKVDKNHHHYEVVLFYARPHRRVFNTEQEAKEHIKKRAQKPKALYYTELWEKFDAYNGEMLRLYDYGCTNPRELQ